MSIYRFGGNSPIDEVTFHHTEGGGIRAYLHARADAPAPAIEAVKKSLTQNAMQWTPILEDGMPALEVRGISKHENELLQLLSKTHATTGSYKVEATPDDHISLKDKIKKNTLSLSGLAYFAGDMGFVFYGYREAFDKAAKRFNPQKLLAGIFYAAGTPFLVFFGRGDKSNIQLKHLSYNLINDLKEKGFDVPSDSAATAVANGHNATNVKKALTFFNRYPAEIANTMFGAAGSMLIWAQLKELKTFNWTPVKDFKRGGMKEVMKFLKRERIPGQSPHDPRSVLLDIGLGLMSVSAGLISVFVEEQAPSTDDNKKTGIAGVMQKIREKPLAAAGASLMAATGMHGVSTYMDWQYVKKDLADPSAEKYWGDAKELRKSLKGRSLFVATNLLAEATMAVSSKGHGAGVKSDQSLEKSAYAVAADLIERAPADKKDALLDTISHFYAHKKHLAGDPAEIAKGIKEQLDSIRDNPWTGRVTSEPAKGNAPAAEENNHWRGKLAAAATATPSAVPAL